MRELPRQLAGFFILTQRKSWILDLERLKYEGGVGHSPMQTQSSFHRAPCPSFHRAFR